jgi:large subunit ribosomal protein L15
MILDDVHRGIEKRRNRKRVGRGPGSGLGKTAGRGHKGFYSRSGAKRRRGYEGGRTPLARRIAKRGFNNNQFQLRIAIVNISDIDKAFQDGETVNPQTLVEKGLAGRGFDAVKILGNGALSKKLSVAAHRFSKSAEDKITAKGGKVERILLS